MLRKIRNSFLFGILFLFGFTFSVSAAVDTSHASSINLNYQYDEKSIENAVVSLYRIASVDENGIYSYIGSFAGRTEDLNNLSASATRTLASSLSEEIEEDNIAYDYQKNTSRTGTVKFDNLTPGVYLILTDEVSDEEQKYVTLPFFVSLPQVENGAYVYDVPVDVKIEAMPLPSPSPSISPDPSAKPSPSNEPDDPNEGKPTTNPTQNPGSSDGNHGTIFSPSTYDDIVIYVSIFAVSLIGVGIVVYYIYKKNKKKKISNEIGKEDGSENEKEN